jgi:hypothetical protein
LEADRVNTLARRYEWIANGNPPVRLRPEKGPPRLKSTRWTEFTTGADLSNTTWAHGWVDFSGARPSVEVHGKISAAEFAAARGGGRKVTYLLHPDKFEDVDGIHPAIGMIPNVSTSPTNPLAYALRVTWDVPVRLTADPGRRKNPRGWFEGRGEAWVREVVGRVRVVSTGKLQPVYREIRVWPAGHALAGWTRLRG